MKDHIKIVFGAAEHSSNHTQNPPPPLPICTVHLVGALYWTNVIITLLKHTTHLSL